MRLFEEIQFVYGDDILKCFIHYFIKLITCIMFLSFIRPLDSLLSCASMFAENNNTSTQVIYEELLRAMFIREKWSDGKSVLQEMKKRVGTVS